MSSEILNSACIAGIAPMKISRNKENIVRRSDKDLSQIFLSAFGHIPAIFNMRRFNLVAHSKSTLANKYNVWLTIKLLFITCSNNMHIYWFFHCLICVYLISYVLNSVVCMCLIVSTCEFYCFGGIHATTREVT